MFLGFLFGSPVWGVVADKFGRKKVSGKMYQYTYMCTCALTLTHTHTHAHTHTHTLVLIHLQTLLVVQIWGVVFGVVSAFSPEYYNLLIFRGLLGFGLGGGFLG